MTSEKDLQANLAPWSLRPSAGKASAAVTVLAGPGDEVTSALTLGKVKKSRKRTKFIDQFS